MQTFQAAVQTGFFISVGFLAHKALTKLVCDTVCDKLFGAGTVAPEPTKAPAPAAVSGLEALQPYKGLIAGAATVLIGIPLTNAVVRDVRTKMLIQGGIATSFVHSLLMVVLNKFAPKAADYLSGTDTAARLSAMYGFGADIMPRYAPIGEYFSEPVSGMGEYFSENLSGLGAYGANPDLYEAAAGYGALPDANTNHISPSSDLDRELSIAEAAAGVGAVQAYEAAAGMGRVQPYEASAGVMQGMGEYFTESMSGLGAVTTVPRADTWVPGMGPAPQIWAGVRGVQQSQAAHAMTSAGILQTPGDNGVFG